MILEPDSVTLVPCWCSIDGPFKFIKKQKETILVINIFCLKWNKPLNPWIPFDTAVMLWVGQLFLRPISSKLFSAQQTHINTHQTLHTQDKTLANLRCPKKGFEVESFTMVGSESINEEQDKEILGVWRCVSLPWAFRLLFRPPLLP